MWYSRYKLNGIRHRFYSFYTFFTYTHSFYNFLHVQFLHFCTHFFYTYSVYIFLHTKLLNFFYKFSFAVQRSFLDKDAPSRVRFDTTSCLEVLEVLVSRRADLWARDAGSTSRAASSPRLVGVLVPPFFALPAHPFRGIN